ncbi:MAG: GAF domain-containing protein, partial [Clostridia bacterium]|nr:GAF domain-containing protein [Clostridia bacterium]
MEEIKKGTTADMLPAMIRETGRGEKDEIAFLCNVSALLFQVLTDVSWAGFYRLIDNELVLGPFQG